MIVGRSEMKLDCSVRTLYRMFQTGAFNVCDLPMKGKRKPNGHQKNVETSFRRSIHERIKEHPEFENEFGHLEGDTIVGRKHKSAVITLVERLSKVIITLKPAGRQAMDIENQLIIGFKRFLNICLNQLRLTVGKNFQIGKLWEIKMTLIFILRIQAPRHNAL